MTSAYRLSTAHNNYTITCSTHRTADKITAASTDGTKTYNTRSSCNNNTRERTHIYMCTHCFATPPVKTSTEQIKPKPQPDEDSSGGFPGACVRAQSSMMAHELCSGAFTRSAMIARESGEGPPGPEEILRRDDARRGTIRDDARRFPEVQLKGVRRNDDTLLLGKRLEAQVSLMPQAPHRPLNTTSAPFQHCVP